MLQVEREFELRRSRQEQSERGKRRLGFYRVTSPVCPVEIVQPTDQGRVQIPKVISYLSSDSRHFLSRQLVVITGSIECGHDGKQAHICPKIDVDDILQMCRLLRLG